ncbi:hypothetical protein [Janibacter alkaliphilus]|uniref:Uncharacterized protein n=1 Tax=Janibacter alkaliphilus TaxID=1069963 RepID=A0A852X3Z9_9MICO|nr:hypothetical protein [Janibacter alkaliphilus]NYG36060.1 hypothetical protein [Janibacter alkaliphilus]
MDLLDQRLVERVRRTQAGQGRTARAASPRSIIDADRRVRHELTAGAPNSWWLIDITEHWID